jgi:hypothetical protein
MQGANSCAAAPRARRACCPRAAYRATQVLFCGLEFNDGFKLTAKELEADPRFDVTACRREDVAAHIADAHIAVRTAGCAGDAVRLALRARAG